MNSQPHIFSPPPGIPSIALICFSSVFSENPFFFCLMSDHKILVIVALAFAWLLSKFITPQVNFFCISQQSLAGNHLINLPFATHDG